MSKSQGQNQGYFIKKNILISQRTLKLTIFVGDSLFYMSTTLDNTEQASRKSFN